MAIICSKTASWSVIISYSVHGGKIPKCRITHRCHAFCRADRPGSCDLAREVPRIFCYHAGFTLSWPTDGQLNPQKYGVSYP
jgi:hypothetical protein